MTLIFEDKIRENKAEFVAKVKDISDKLDIDPNWLMAVMYFESGINSRAQNTSYPIQGGYATGLIQFAPETARSLGTNTEALKSMSNVQQLDYVYRYFKPYVSKLNSYVDLYLVTFFPAIAGKPDNTIIKSDTISADTIARSNPVFDLNKNNSLTVGEVKSVILNKIPANLREEFKKSFSPIMRFAKRNVIPISIALIGLIGLIGLTYIYVKK
jgi:hypothetical protein